MCVCHRFVCISSSRYINFVLLLDLFFFFNDTATTEIYTLSLHDALPIYDLPYRRCKERVSELRATGMPLGLMPGSFYEEHEDRKSTRLNSSHVEISYAVFCLKKKRNKFHDPMRAQTLPLAQSAQSDSYRI